MKKRLFFCIATILTLSSLLAIYLKLNAHGQFVLGCSIYHNTGYACPTCGFTDMLQHLSHLQIIHAYYSNKYMFLTLPLWIFLFAKFLVHYIKTGKLLNSKPINYIFIALIIIGIFFGILRNF